MGPEPLATLTSTVVDPAVTTDVAGLVALLARAFQSGDYVLGSGLLLTLVVVGLRYLPLVRSLPKDATKWIAVAVAVLTSVALGLQTRQDGLTIALTGVSVGFVAVGGWETVGEGLRSLLRRVGWLKGPEAETAAPAPTDPA